VRACCSQCPEIAGRFDRRIADADRERYHQLGPGPTTRLILQELGVETDPAGSLLDVGGGIGVIGLELLGTGLHQVTLVEASPAYAAVAAEQFEARGVGDRLQCVVGDFAAMEQPAGADLVTLDRVVCCYPDAGRLLQQAARCARRALALSYPRDRWYVRLGNGASNLLRLIRRVGFRTFVHPEAAIAGALAAAGLRRARRRTTFVWCVEVWTRTPEGSEG